jgi:hypothetical protein
VSPLKIKISSKKISAGSVARRDLIPALKGLTGCWREYLYLMRETVTEGKKLRSVGFQSYCTLLDITRIMSTALFLMQMWGEYCWRWVPCLVILYMNFAKRRINGVDVFMLIFTIAQHPPVSQGLLIVKDSWLHSDILHSVGLLWTSVFDRAATVIS